MATSKRNSIYYEFWKDGSYVSTGFKTLGNFQIQTGIDTVPTMSINLPISELPKADTSTPLVGFETNFARYEIHVFIQTEGKTKYKFFGVVDSVDFDFAAYNVTFKLSHRIARMREWAMPVNFTVKNTSFSQAIGKAGCQLGSSSTIPSQSYDMDIDIELQTANEPTLEMTFSSTNKLAALSEACEQTENLHWRVDLTDTEQDHIIISEFGAEQECLISPNPIPTDDCSDTDNSNYVTMLTEPTISIDYTNHFNRAVVFCGDVGFGVLHLTLKSIYDHPELQDPDFPVGIYDKEINLQPETAYADEDASDAEQCEVSKINNERVYYTGNINEDGYKTLVLADNDNREYYITDNKTLQDIDNGVIKQTTYNFSDLYPIPKLSGTDENCEEVEYMITEEDRLEITKRAYAKAIRNLKYQRPDFVYQFNCGALPVTVQDGDKVNFAYAKKMFPQFPEEIGAECEKQEEEMVINIKGSFYVTKRTITFDDVLNEYTTITLDGELRIHNINAREIELTEKIEEATEDSSSNDYESPVKLPGPSTDVSERVYTPDTSVNPNV